MAEYKNWYLARGSGMKDERKKLKLIILQCIAVITANFITIWYFEELFFRGFWYVIFASFILTFIYKRKNDWKLNDRWAWFIGDNRQSLKLTTKPEPYTLDRTLRWVQRQVAPTLKMLKKIDKGNGTDYMETIEQQAKLTEKHEMIIKQQTTPAKDLVES